MMNNYTTGLRCLLSFDFDEEVYQSYYNEFLDSGMGVTEETVFIHAVNVIVGLQTLEDILSYLDAYVFPEHVPNDALQLCHKLYVNFIVYLVKNLSKYKPNLNCLVANINDIQLIKRGATVIVMINE